LYENNFKIFTNISVSIARRGKMPSENGHDIDYILDHYVGGGGRWQWLIFFATFPTCWASTYPLFMHMFTAYKPDHRCFVPSCDDQTSRLNSSHTDFTIPKKHLYTNIFMENAKLDPCRLIYCTAFKKATCQEAR